MNKKVNDSVIDPPKPGLCPEIWEKVVDSTGTLEIWQLKPTTRQQLLEVVKELDKFGWGLDSTLLEDVHITGSITSNLYTENADIDLHFVAGDVRLKESPDNTSARLRAAMKQLVAQKPALGHVGKHPIEVYYQPNTFQDFMSVGCYSLFSEAWLVGPEIKDASYNPYDDMYHEIKKISEKLLADIRQIVLTTYEKAIVLLKASKFSSAKVTVDEAYAELEEALKHAVELYQNARMMRKRLSDPTSHEEALKMREDKKWKVVDATFKLLDKFGYLAILKDMQRLLNLSFDKSVAAEAASSIVNSVKSHIGDPEKLADSERIEEKLMLKLHEMKIVVDSLSQKLSRRCNRILKEGNDDNVKFVKDFMEYFGYRDNYFPKKNCGETRDSLAQECAMRMPTDTAAREIEGDAVMLMVLSGDDDAVKAGKKLGNCMMKNGKHDEETLLKLMSDAYKAMLSLDNKYHLVADPRKMEEAVKRTFSGKMKLMSEHWEPKYDDMPYNQWGEKWVKLPNGHYVVGCIEDAAKSCQLDPADEGPKIDDLRVSSVHAFSNGNLFVTVFGGANGGKTPGKCSFEQYLALAKKFINKLLAGYGKDKMFEDAWLVDWDNDCCDDVWTLRFCLALDKDQLQKFKDCTKLPPEEDYAETIKRQEQMQESSLKPAALAAIISMLAIPGILPKTALAAEMNNINKSSLTINSPEMKNAIAIATNGSYNGLNLTNTVNAVARTIYEEAKGEGKVGQDAVASVIWNRAGGKAKNMVPTISAKLQFSCWNEYTGGWKDANYKFKIPSDVFKNSKNKEIWQYCSQLAIKLVNEEFTSTIGDFNSYLNKDKADPEAVESWGKLCNKKLGHHWFGYQSCYDGFKKARIRDDSISHGITYIVKKGDNLEKIAKSNDTTVASIMKLNNMKDKNKLKIGQKLKL